MARRALTLLAGLAAAACSHDDASGPGGPFRVERPLQQRSGGADVVIRSRWQPRLPGAREAGLPSRFSRPFESDAEADFTFTPIGTPAPDVPTVAPSLDPAAAASGTGGLRFPAAQGAALWWLPARPLTRYVVTCAVRGAGRLVVRELARNAQRRHLDPLPLAMLEGQFGPTLAEHRAAAAAASAAPAAFAPQRVEFETGAKATSIVLLLRADAEPPDARVTPGGPVDFDDLLVFEVPLARALAAEHDAGAAATPTTWESWRRALTLAGELRPALIAAPPTEIRVPIALPAGPFRLRFGYGVCEERRDAFGREPIRFFARLELRTTSIEIPLPRPILRAREVADDAGWHECRYDGIGDGGTAILTLATTTESGRESDDVALFSEPQLDVAPRAPAAGSRPPNVLLISLDTLRRDRLGLYGYRRRDGEPTSPRLDALAKECVVFDDARTLAPYTLPAHATLFTGMHPSVHGIEHYDSAVRPDIHPLLARRFAEAGCATAAFTAGGFLGPEHGLWHGFDRWSLLDPFMPSDDPTRRYHPRLGDQAFNDLMWQRCSGAAIRGFIAEHADEPFLLFVHTYVVHNYRVPPDLLSRFVKNPARLTFNPIVDNDERTPTPAEIAALTDYYDATVAAVDREVGALIDQLRASGLLERTIVVILSDHGEEHGEHGGFGHGRTLYDEILRVPLLIRAPGVAPRTETAPVTLADVAPTLLALAGLEPLAGGCGRVLLPQLAEQDDSATGIVAALDEIHLGRQRALLQGSRKLIEVDRMSPIRPPLSVLSLFDLPADSGERHDLVVLGADGMPVRASGQPAELSPLRARLADLFARFARARAELGVDVGAPSVVNPDLEAIGYGKDAPRDPPRDR